MRRGFGLYRATGIDQHNSDSPHIRFVIVVVGGEYSAMGTHEELPVVVRRIAVSFERNSCPKGVVLLLDIRIPSTVI